MALFGGSEAIEYGDARYGQLFAWRHANRELRPRTPVIVHEGQRTVFVMSGRVVGTLGPGRHILDGNNVPFLAAITKQFFGGAFSSQLWFINQVTPAPIPWGTPERIRVPVPDDPNLLVTVGARGNYKASVTDLEVFFNQYLAALQDEVTAKDLNRLLRAKMLDDIKSTIATAFRTSRIDVFAIDQHLPELSSLLSAAVGEALLDVGVQVIDFNVTDVNTEGDQGFEEVQRQRLERSRKANEVTLAGQGIDLARNEALARSVGTQIDADAAAYAKLAGGEADARVKSFDADAEAYSQQVRNYSYQDEKRFDVLKTAASNEGEVGPLMGLGMGLGMGGAVGKAVGSMMDEVSEGESPGAPPAASAPGAAQSEGSTTHKFCTKCGTRLPADAAFCSGCGAPQSAEEA